MRRRLGWIVATSGLLLMLGGCLEPIGAELASAAVEDTPCVLAVDCPLGAVCGEEGHCAIADTEAGR